MASISPFEMNNLLLNEEVSMLLLNEWIGFWSLGHLDMAITNHRTRTLWLQCLVRMNNSDCGTWMQCYSSMRWLITRGVKISRIMINDMDPIHRITARTFDDFHIDTLQYVSLAGCLNR